MNWRPAHGTEGNFGCLEIAARLCATHKMQMQMRCSACVVALGRGDKGHGWQVRRYLGAKGILFLWLELTEPFVEAKGWF
jgi:hypothetical protein